MSTQVTPSTCKAAVFRQPGCELNLVDVAVPTVQPGELLVRVTCCTICGSDLHTFTGNRTSPAPSVLGHEIVGVVESTGSDDLKDYSGRSLQPGTRVTWSVAASCGNCDRCESGLPQKCHSLFKYGHEEFTDRDELSGGLAEYCLIKPGTTVIALPGDADDRVFCPANCATATVAAAFRMAGDVNGDKVAIFGAGMLGLTASAFAASYGAKQVCVCDPFAGRRQLATDFGATQVTDRITTEDYDVAFELSGNSKAVADAINSVGIGGRVILVGSVSPSDPVAVDPERVVRRLLTIHGVHNYRPEDLATAVDFLIQHGETFPFATLVERSFPLMAVNDAFQYAIRERPVRVATRVENP